MGRFSIHSSAITFGILLTLLFVALSPTQTHAATLQARVLSDATIDLRQNGVPVTSLPEGNYTIIVEDSTADHNFHLFGPGVEQKTSVAGQTNTSWQVTFTPGKYEFICDPHPSWMRGSFNVYAAATPTPTPTPAPTQTTTPKPTTTVTSHSSMGHPMFISGDTVYATGNVNIRATPSVTGSKVGVATLNGGGKVEQVSALIDGYIWLKIRYNNGLYGWSVQDWLSKSTTATTPTASTPTSPNFVGGDSIVTTSNLRVRSNPTISGALLGTALPGQQGIIESQSVFVDNYVWWKVKFTNGLEGWSVGNWMQRSATQTTFPTTPTTQTPITSTVPALQAGNPVVAVTNLRVRATPSLSGGLVGTASSNAYGTILDTQTVVADGYVWRKVQFAGGLTGWAADSFLTKPTQTTTTTVAESGPPAVTSAYPPPASLNTAYFYQITATNNPTVFSASGLPPGLTINPTTGLISGVPTAAGYYQMTFTASNGVGSVTNKLTFQVVDGATNTNTNSTGGAPTVLVARVLSNATIDLRYQNGSAVTSIPAGSYTIQVEDSTVDHNFHLFGPGVDQTTSVAGVGNTTWSVTFTPGVYSFVCDPHASWMKGSFTVTASNSNNTNTNTQNNGQPPAFSGQPNYYATLSQFYSYQPSVANTPTSFSASGLPPGISINSTSGLISGTPAVTGTYNVSVTASNQNGSGTMTYSLFVTSSSNTNNNNTNTGGSNVLVARVLNDATIDLRQNGALVSTLPAGTYTIQVEDSTTAHNFHLSGPGVEQTTTVAGTGNYTWTVNFTPGSYEYLCDPHASWMNGSFTVTSGPQSVSPPTLNPSGVPTGTVGMAYTYQISSTNSPTSFSASGLPTGVNINPSTGYISGTPITAGNYTVILTAANVAGTASVTFTLTVQAQSQQVSPPSITSSSMPLGTQNSSYTYQITATNNPTSFGATGLPSGLSLNSSTGLVSGTLTAAGNYTVTLSATNSAGSGTATYSVSIAPPQSPSVPSITSGSMSSGTTNVSYSYQIAASNSPTSFSASGLPTGLNVNTATGLISGAPTQTGTFTVTISATNGAGTGSTSRTLTISSGTPSTPSITSPLTSSGTVGSAYTYQITASNSPTNYGATNLPPGFSVNTGTGVISGTLGSTGSYPITLTATNAGGTGSATLVLTVTAAAPSAPVISTSMLTSGLQGSAYSFQVTASNSPTSYGASGLPTGLTINSSTGLISGTPSTAGSYTVVLSATNAGGSGTKTLNLSVAAPSQSGMTLTARVVNSSTIDIKDANGTIISNIPAGTYTIQVTDSTSSHNIHLTGPGGVNQTTSVNGTGTYTWTVTFVPGSYLYVCDPHSDSMRKTFTVH